MNKLKGARFRNGSAAIPRNKRRLMLRAVSRARVVWQLGRLALFSAAVCLTFGSSAKCTVVGFYTSEGTFYVRLYDTATPLNVANFLKYVNNGLYNSSFIHRYEPGLVLQGGGYTYTSQNG